MAKQQSDGQARWYAIHTYAGYENAVVTNLKQRIKSLANVAPDRLGKPRTCSRASSLIRSSERMPDWGACSPSGSDARCFIARGPSDHGI